MEKRMFPIHRVKLLSLAVVLVLTIGLFPGCSRTVDTPEKLLLKIQALAKKQKYEELREYIYPLVLSNSNYQDLMVDGIKEKKKWGECAFSEEALAAVIANHLDGFHEIPREMREIVMEEVQNVDLRKIVRERPQDFLVLEYKEATITVVKIAEEYKLLYWESMNSVL
jgi:hypothetical protein